MKLDRNLPVNRGKGIGKYALIKMREFGGSLPSMGIHPITGERVFLVPDRLVDFGNNENDFFVIRLKDKYAVPALLAYADAAEADDLEYAEEIRRLAVEASQHPNIQKPT